MKYVLVFAVVLPFLFAYRSNLLKGLFKTRKLRCNNRSEISIAQAIEVLADYDKKYIMRQKNARMSGNSPVLAEIMWMQSLGSAEVQNLWTKVKESSKTIVSSTDEIVLGIKAETGEEALAALRSWVSGLSLQRGVLRAYDEIGNEVPYDLFLAQPAYIKYNATDSGNAYMKSYEGDQMGVIFQMMWRGEFFQMGDFPLTLFQQ